MGAWVRGSAKNSRKTNLPPEVSITKQFPEQSQNPLKTLHSPVEHQVAQRSERPLVQGRLYTMCHMNQWDAVPCSYIVHMSALDQTCTRHERPAREVGHVRNQPCTLCHPAQLVLSLLTPSSTPTAPFMNRKQPLRTSCGAVPSQHPPLCTKNSKGPATIQESEADLPLASAKQETTRRGGPSVCMHPCTGCNRFLLSSGCEWG